MPAAPNPFNYDTRDRWENRTTIGAAVGGRWESFVYHTRYAYDATGFVELWRNGRKVVNWHSIATAYNDQPADGGKPPYLKIGVYKWGWKEPADYDVTDSQVTYSELRVGDASSSFAEVDTAPPGVGREREQHRRQLQIQQGQQERSPAGLLKSDDGDVKVRRPAEQRRQTLYDLDAVLLDGSPIPLATLKGNVALVTNPGTF